MTLAEAEQFYKAYDGNSFHMDREEPAMYGAFKSLALSPEITRKWDEDLIEGIFGSLWEQPKRAWSLHHRLIDLIRRNKEERYFVRLLDEMEKMDTLDKESKVLIIENMAGRDLALKGGCMLLETFPAHAERVDWIMNKIMDFTYSENGLLNKMGLSQSDRLEKAKAAYRRAFRKWTANQ